MSDGPTLVSDGRTEWLLATPSEAWMFARLWASATAHAMSPRASAWLSDEEVRTMTRSPHE